MEAAYSGLNERPPSDLNKMRSNSRLLMRNSAPSIAGARMAVPICVIPPAANDVVRDEGRANSTDQRNTASAPSREKTTLTKTASFHPDSSPVSPAPAPA